MDNAALTETEVPVGETLTGGRAPQFYATVRYCKICGEGAKRCMCWQGRAKCRGMDVDWFYAARGQVEKNLAARRICLECEVRTECLAAALRNCETCGVWGGSSERERRKLRRKVLNGADPVAVAKRYVTRPPAFAK